MTLQTQQGRVKKKRARLIARFFVYQWNGRNIDINLGVSYHQYKEINIINTGFANKDKFL